MKSIFSILCILFISLTTYSQQNDPKATEILNGVSAKYKTYKTLQADFTIKIESGQGNVSDQQTGTIYINGNKYRLVLKNQEIISDNITIWTYLKDANEVQVNSFEPDESTITPAQIFTIYEKNFLYALVEEKMVNGKIMQVIDLTPLDKSKPYFKVRLHVDKVNKTVQSGTVFDKNGNRYTYELKNLVANPALADAFFSFDKTKYPGVEVVDLR